MIIALNGLATSVGLEVVIEVLSLEANLDIFGWVKYKILGFSKLVRLSMSQHEKLMHRSFTMVGI